MQSFCAKQDRGNSMCKVQEGSSDTETIVFERKPSMYFLLERDTMLLFRLAGLKLKPAQQERLYWNLLHMLNTLEDEEKEMTSYHGYEQNEKKKKDTFDGGGYGIFWDEYHAIEQSHPVPSIAPVIPDSEDGTPNKEDKSEREIQWLSDVGFTNIAKKIRARHEIDQNDDEMKIIAASLTRAQANAVRRRIDSLNEAIRGRNTDEKSSPSPSSSFSSSTKQRRHVKDIFGSNGRNSPNSSSVKKIQNDVSWIKKGDSTTAPKQSPDKPQVYGTRPAIAPKPDSIKQKSIQRRQSPDNNRNGDVKVNGCVNHLSVESKETSPRDNQQISNPQVDNLVRRTSAHSLIIMSGEEREKSLVRPKSACIPREMDKDSREFDFENTNNDNSQRRRANNLKKRETFDSSSLRKKSGDFSSSAQTKPSKYPITKEQDINNKTSRRRYSDIVPAVSQEKRLVVVDSTYINVSSVGDGYTTVKTNDTKTEPRKERTESENSTFYTMDHNSLQPYDLSLDVSLPQDLSNMKIKTNSNTSLSRSPSPGEVTLSVEDGNIPSAPRARKEKKNKLKEHDASSTKEKTKHKKKHKHHHHHHKKHKSEEGKENEQTPTNGIVEKNDTKETSVEPTPLKKADVTPTTVNSDDNKSVGSVGSADDLQFSNDAKNLFPKPKTVYYNSSDSNRTTPEKSLDSTLGSALDISTPRTQSPLCIEGDAKLNVGSTSSPRGLERTPTPDALQGPNFPKLPNFTLTKEELGMTHIGDLSENDMQQTRRLALIELTALFDNCSIAMNRRKPQIKLKFKEHGTFGVPLTTLCSREESKHNPDVKVPKLFLQLLGYIETFGIREEGLLRVPGSAQRVKAIREEADKNPDLSTLTWEGRKMTDIATCVKQFCRDLPEPLLTYEYQNSFTSVADLPDRKVQLQALNLLVVLLPPVHQETLKTLLVFLTKVVANESSNKMGLNNVAMIMAPNLFFQNNAKININEAQKAAGMTDVLRMLIKYQKILWTIPSFMVSQIRFLYEAGAKTKDPKALSKIIKRRKLESPSHPSNVTIRTTRPGSSGDELEDFDENLIIRVKAPTLNKQSMAIQLSTQTTVSEVVSKFQWQRQKSNKAKDEIATDRLRIKPTRKESEVNNTELFLYEVGGNIGERRLDPSACISAILKENPNAEWMLKSEVKK